MANKNLNEYLHLYELDQEFLKQFDERNYYPSLTYSGERSSHRSPQIIRMLDKLEKVEDYVNFVEKAKDVIGLEFYEIVMNDYFIGRRWYLKKYSASTYYRKKRKAEEAFMNYMDCFTKYNY